MKKAGRYLKKSVNRVAAACVALAVFSGTPAIADSNIHEMAYKEEKRILKKAPEEVVFKNVNVIPMTGETILRKQSVYIKDGIIEEIDEFEDLEISKSAKIINGRGKYLLPGFSDMHVHTNDVSDRILYVANGVTLIRNMWGWPSTPEEKRSYREKELLGPELYSTGPLLDGPEPFWDGSTVLEKPEQVAGVLQKIKEDGFDAVKVYDKLSPAVYDEIISVSKQLDLPVMGHVPYQVGLKKVMAAGQISNEHLFGYMPGPELEALAEETVASGIWNCPTLVVKYNSTNLEQLKKDGVKGLKFTNPRWPDMWSGFPPRCYAAIPMAEASLFRFNLADRKNSIASSIQLD